MKYKRRMRKVKGEDTMKQEAMDQLMDICTECGVLAAEDMVKYTHIDVKVTDTRVSMPTLNDIEKYIIPDKEIVTVRLTGKNSN